MNKVKKLPKSPDKKKFHENMNKVLQKLEKKGIELEKLNAVEVFGREGDWHTVAYCNKVKSMEIWEINESYKKNLEKNCPNAIIRILDSIENILNYNKKKKFNFIVIDNPMSNYGKNDSYCEHFNIIENIENISTKNPIIVFNVNRNPFNLNQNRLWKKRREQFYKTNNTSKLTIDFLLQFYQKLFEEEKWKVVFSFFIARHEYLDYLVFKLEKT